MIERYKKSEHLGSMKHVLSVCAQKGVILLVYRLKYVFRK